MKIEAIFVDAANTLLHVREPVGMTYARFARKHGMTQDPVQVGHRFKSAFQQAGAMGLRQRKDGRPFWRFIVESSLDAPVSDALFASLYEYYASPKAWWVDTEALRVLGNAARKGAKLGILSNYDGRLRTLYERYALDRMFPTLICSGEHGVEKPDPWIFHLACRCIGARPQNCVHIGDDPVRDVEGATHAGLKALHFEEESGWTRVEQQLATLSRQYLL